MLRTKSFCIELTAILFYAQASKTRLLQRHSFFSNRLKNLSEYFQEEEGANTSRILPGGQKKAFRRNSIKLFSDCRVHSDLFWCPALQYLIRALTFEYIGSPPPPPGFKVSLLFCNILLNCVFS